MSDLIAGNIRLCQHPHTVRVCLRAADVDAIDTGAGIAGVDAAGIEHSVHRNVIGEYTAAVDLFCRVNAFGVLVHVQRLRRGRNRLFLAEKLCRH